MISMSLSVLPTWQPGGPETLLVPLTTDDEAIFHSHPSMSSAEVN